VRGLVGNPQPDVEQVRNGKLNVGGAVGTDGMLTVTKDLGLGQPYVGTVEIVSGEVGEDLAHYLAVSEQTRPPSASASSSAPTAPSKPPAATSIQLLPGVTDEDAERSRNWSGTLPHPTPCSAPVSRPSDPQRIFGDGFRCLEERDVRFECHCSRDRANEPSSCSAPMPSPR
jgi:molecular chaperone Hsp33